MVWIGNWGDEERTAELMEFLVAPGARLVAEQRRVLVHGVRYPREAQETLRRSGIEYAGYLPNLSAPEVYAQQPGGAACAAPPVCQRTERGADDSRL